MNRHWVLAAGVAAAVVASAGVAAVATTGEEPQTPTAPAAGNAVQARWGQDSGNGPGKGQGLGQGYRSTNGAGPAGHGPGRGGGGGTQGQQRDPATNLPAASSIEEDTEQVLRYMAEEEKLAHDVYVALGAQYEARQFDNIARAETQHLDAVRVLLDRYSLDDPTVGAEAGQFTNDTLQGMYDDLVAAGSTSLADAAQVGATIEETDIGDLSDAIDGATAADVVQVLTSLRDGSERHLAAFQRLADRA